MSRTPDWMDCHRTPEDALRGVAFYAPRFPADARCRAMLSVLEGV